MKNKKIIFSVVFIAGFLLLIIYFYSDNDASKEIIQSVQVAAVQPINEPQVPDVIPESEKSQTVVVVPKKKKIAPEQKKTIVKKDLTLVKNEVAEPVPDAIEQEYEQNQFFETLVKGSFPVYTIQAHNPLEPEAPGPKYGEIWLRIKPENASEMNEIMAEVADLYKDIAMQTNEDIVVVHWVGAQPYAVRTYSPDGTIK